MLLYNEWINNEIKEEIKRYLKTNENEDTTIQNLWENGKAILRGKFLHCRPISKKKKKTIKSSNKQYLHLKELETEQQTKPNMSVRKEIIKIRAEINEIESKKMI